MEMWQATLQTMTSNGWAVRWTDRGLHAEKGGVEHVIDWPKGRVGEDELAELTLMLMRLTLPACEECGLPCKYGDVVHPSCDAMRWYETQGGVLD